MIEIRPKMHTSSEKLFERGEKGDDSHFVSVNVLILKCHSCPCILLVRNPSQKKHIPSNSPPESCFKSHVTVTHYNSYVIVYLAHTPWL